MLLVMNAHKRKHHSQVRLLSKGEQAQIRNRTVDVDHAQETEEEIWKGITSRHGTERQRD